MRDLASSIEDLKYTIEVLHRDIRSGTLCDLQEYKTKQKINYLKRRVKKLEKENRK